MEACCVLGIDIGTATIKVFAGELGADGEVTVIGSGAAPTIGFAKGVITDAPALANVVKQAVDCALIAADIPMQAAYVGIGGLGINSFNGIGSIAPVSASGITAADLDRVHLASVLTTMPDEREALHVLPLRYWLDGSKETQAPVRRKGTRLEAETHIVTVLKVAVRELISALGTVGIVVTGVVANAIVSAQALLPDPTLEDCLVMDLGAGITDLVLYQEGQVQMSASLPIGGEYITTDLMQGLKVTHLHAEGIKRYYGKLEKSLYGQNIELDCNDYGTTDKKFLYDFVYNIVESRVDEIATILFEYAKPLLNQYCISRIYVTGGCALMPSMIESIHRTFEIRPDTIQAPGLSAEYAHPTSTACFGILSYAMNNRPEPSGSGKNSWRSVFGKLKDFF
jgi:cell division protein FtsA